MTNHNANSQSLRLKIEANSIDPDCVSWLIKGTKIKNAYYYFRLFYYFHFQVVCGIDDLFGHIQCTILHSPHPDIITSGPNYT